MTDARFDGKKVDLDKLLRFGFVAQDGEYAYTADILGGQFRAAVTVSRDGAVHTKVIDAAMNEEYALHRTPEASGTFVGSVRADLDAILREICAQCFEPDVFKGDTAQQVVRYVRETYRDELEYLWRRFPNNAVFRRRDTKKWYAALLVLSRRKLGLDSNETVDILDLRAAPEEVASLVDGKKYFPGYHMNKKHWYTICLDGSVPFGEIQRRVDASYELADKPSPPGYRAAT